MVFFQTPTSDTKRSLLIDTFLEGLTAENIEGFDFENQVFSTNSISCYISSKSGCRHLEQFQFNPNVWSQRKKKLSLTNLMEKVRAMVLERLQVWYGGISQTLTLIANFELSGCYQKEQNKIYSCAWSCTTRNNLLKVLVRGKRTNSHCVLYTRFFQLWQSFCILWAMFHC